MLLFADPNCFNCISMSFRHRWIDSVNIGVNSASFQLCKSHKMQHNSYIIVQSFQMTMLQYLTQGAVKSLEGTNDEVRDLHRRGTACWVERKIIIGWSNCRAQLLKRDENRGMEWTEGSIQRLLIKENKEIWWRSSLFCFVFFLFVILIIDINYEPMNFMCFPISLV